MKRVIATLLLSLVALSASAKNMYIPVAGKLAGVNGTFFRTDVRIFNPSDEYDIAVSIHYLPTGIDGSNISGRVVPVPKRQMVVLNDIVGTMFSDFIDAEGNALGALRLDSDTDASYEFVADARIYTDSPNPAVNGTYGQYVPAMTLSDAKLKTVVLHLKSPFDTGIPGNGSTYRTNIGVMNPGSEPATVVPLLFGADGTPLGVAAELTVPPKSMVQLPLSSVFGAAFFNDGFVTFSSTQPVYTWGSVIDNHSGDQVFIRGIEDKAERVPIFPE